MLEIFQVPIFRQKGTIFTFLAQICPKVDLGSEIQKTNVGIRIRILEIACFPIFKQNEQLWLSRSKFTQKSILGESIKNLSLDSKLTPPRYHAWQFLVKTLNFSAEIWGNCLITCDIFVLITLRCCRAGWKLKWDGWSGWSWMELSGGGCTVYQYPFYINHVSHLNYVKGF